MGKAVFYSENSVMSPFVDAAAFQHKSMMKKGRLKLDLVSDDLFTTFPPQNFTPLCNATIPALIL